jgi:hypothetical protein
MDIGKYKLIVDRQRVYFSYLSNLMIVYLFLKDVGLKWWYLLILPIAIVWAFIDIKHIMPKELSYWWKKNPETAKLNRKEV